MSINVSRLGAQKEQLMLTHFIPNRVEYTLSRLWALIILMLTQIISFLLYTLNHVAFQQNIHKKKTKQNNIYIL